MAFTEKIPYRKKPMEFQFCGQRFLGKNRIFATFWPFFLHFGNFHRISGQNFIFFKTQKKTLNIFLYFFQKSFLSKVCPTEVIGRGH